MMTNLLKIFGFCTGLTKLSRLFLKDTYHVYVVTNHKKTLFQVGITTSLHKQREQWCRLYNRTWDLPGSNDLCIYVVYYEHFSNLTQARIRKRELEAYSLQKIKELVTTQKVTSAR